MGASSLVHQIQRQHLITISLFTAIIVLVVFLFQYRDDQRLFGLFNFNFTRSNFRFPTTDTYYSQYSLSYSVNSNTKKDSNDWPEISTEHVYRTQANIEELWTNLSIGTIARRVAHYDNRTGAYDDPVIIVLLYWNMRVQPLRPVHYGKVVYSNKTEVMLKTSPSWVEGVRWPVAMKMLNFKLIFSLPSNEKPEVLYICNDKNCSNHQSAYITVRQANKIPNNEVVDFAVCLHQPLFDFYDIEMLVSWIEMNKILGARKIYIYYQNINERVEAVVNKYVEEGLIETHDWFCNFTSEEQDSNNFGQLLMITDCFYRSMYQVKHLVLYDLDELIIPRSGHSMTWHDMIKEIEATQKPMETISNFKFCVTSFHDTGSTVLSPNTLNNSMVKLGGCSNFIDIPLVFKRTASTDYSHNPMSLCKSLYHYKNIIFPERVKAPRIHEMTPMKGFQEYTVHPYIAMQHHYRVTDTTMNEKRVKDFIMIKYYSEAIENISNRLCNVFQDI